MKIRQLATLSILLALSAISFAASAATPGPCTDALQAAVNNATITITNLEQGNGTEALVNAAGMNANEVGAQAICTAADLPNVIQITLDITTSIGENAATASLITLGDYPLAIVYLNGQIAVLNNAIALADGK
ncbi:hypothetical protein ISP15_03180 [Dyella jejuensis]|uniref:Uncharacterized protein n=1 Tax=Dyella jejuensis TaxID=1432009 RepID=A0ABW8JE32_9GAMM